MILLRTSVVIDRAVSLPIGARLQRGSHACVWPRCKAQAIVLEKWSLNSLPSLVVQGRHHRQHRPPKKHLLGMHSMLHEHLQNQAQCNDPKRESHQQPLLRHLTRKQHSQHPSEAAQMRSPSRSPHLHVVAPSHGQCFLLLRNRCSSTHLGQASCSRCCRKSRIRRPILLLP